jgi:uncharacterized Zn finger protein
MTRAATYAKALRYIKEDRVELFSQTHTAIVCRVRGDSGSWLVVGDDSGYTCTCPAKRTCSHIIATEALCHPAKLQNGRRHNLD